MKNIFKFMGMALIAGSLLFVACNKDENDDNGNNNNNQNQPATPKATVTFGSATWEVGASVGTNQYVAQYGLMYERLYKVDEQLPYVDLFHTPTAGTYTTEANIATQYEGTDSAYTDVSGDTDADHVYSIEYGEQTQVQTQSGYHGDWAMLNATMTISSFDANALKASFNVTARMYDYYSWMYSLVNDVEDADVENLTIAVENFTFTAASK